MVGKHEYMNMGPRIYRVCYATEYNHHIFQHIYSLTSDEFAKFVGLSLFSNIHPNWLLAPFT